MRGDGRGAWVRDILAVQLAFDDVASLIFEEQRMRLRSRWSGNLKLLDGDNR